MTESRVVRHAGEGWSGVEPRRYKDDGAHHRGVERHTLLPGSEGGAGFETRYFEVAPGGFTSFERHAHVHAVIVVRGSGSVRLGDRTEVLTPLDVVYVAPWEPHRFHAADHEPLGFVCVVDRERDRPRVMEPDEDAP